MSLIALKPSTILAKGYIEFARLSEGSVSENSQTMQLLEGYLNTNPTSVGGPVASLADKTVLTPHGEDVGEFVDLGKLGGGQISIYIVREGDTISGIAEMFGVSSNTIVWANDLKSRNIRVGQELIILPISGVKHVVKSGDTIQSLSKKYKADADDILSFNELMADAKLATGEIVIIPDGVINVSSTNTLRIGKQQSLISGYFMRPLRGGVKSQGIHGYNGIDIAAPVGTPILASADGTVILARTSGYNGGYGLYVVIRHDNGTQTLYAHMSKVNVTSGQKVSQGEIIGAVGNTGRSTGPHIHFEVRGARNPF